MNGHPKFTPRVEPRRKPDGNYGPGDFFFPRAATVAEREDLATERVGRQRLSDWQHDQLVDRNIAKHDRHGP